MTTRRRSLRSIVVRAVVFLLLGAVVNVAVAWGCAAWSTLKVSDEMTSAFMQAISKAGVMDTLLSLEHVESHENHLAAADSSHVWTPGAAIGYGVGLRVTMWTEFGFPRSMYERPTREGRHTNIIPNRETIRIYESGWPCISLAGKRCNMQPLEENASSSAEIWHDQYAFAVYEAPRFAKWDSRLLPLRPLWPRFAINTFFYAAILWLLFAAPGRVRRWRRIRRGLCAKCAYPLGTSDVCTECGTAIRPSGAAACSHG